jgi:hypothetical protein
MCAPCRAFSCHLRSVREQACNLGTPHILVQPELNVIPPPHTSCLEGQIDPKKPEFAPLGDKAITTPTVNAASNPKAKTITERREEAGRSFIHQLTSGLAGWLTFEQMQGGVDNLREAELAKPLQLIARGRGFEIEGEFPLPRDCCQRGAPTRIDFLLVHRRKKLIIAIETKYKKAGRKMAGGIGIDAKRLYSLTTDIIEQQIQNRCNNVVRDSVDGYVLVCAVVVVWHESAIMEQIHLEPKSIKRQFLQLVAALLPKGLEATSRNFAEAMMGVLPTRPVARLAGALRPGSTYTYRRFWVASLINQPDWAHL